jgi:hypothetical protein
VGRTLLSANVRITTTHVGTAGCPTLARSVRKEWEAAICGSYQGMASAMPLNALKSGNVPSLPGFPKASISCAREKYNFPYDARSPRIAAKGSRPPGQGTGRTGWELLQPGRDYRSRCGCRMAAGDRSTSARRSIRQGRDYPLGKGPAEGTYAAGWCRNYRERPAREDLKGHGFSHADSHQLLGYGVLLARVLRAAVRGGLTLRARRSNSPPGSSVHADDVNQPSIHVPAPGAITF